jgi:uncharacterized damage-inducible protein DinB
MITPAWCRVMAAYNTEMNRRFYTAAAGLTDAARRQQRGAFFGSLHGTLCHLLWADTVWLCRFEGRPLPAVSLAESPAMVEAFAGLRQAREAQDAAIEAWAATLTQAGLDRDLTYFSGAVGREMTKPMALLASHLFNHQTHHRGQAHALLTASGVDPGATDLPFVVP